MRISDGRLMELERFINTARTICANISPDDLPEFERWLNPDLPAHDDDIEWLRALLELKARMETQPAFIVAEQEQVG